MTSFKFCNDWPPPDVVAFILRHTNRMIGNMDSMSVHLYSLKHCAQSPKGENNPGINRGLSAQANVYKYKEHNVALKKKGNLARYT